MRDAEMMGQKNDHAKMACAVCTAAAVAEGARLGTKLLCTPPVYVR